MKKENKNGCIYILTNPSFPEYVKIGYADDLQYRLKCLNRSECIPFAFRVFAVYQVNERLKDLAVHSMIDNINPNLRAIETFDGKKRKKEFYAMSANDAYSIFETIAKLSGTMHRLKKLTPEGHEITDEEIANDIEKNNKYTEEGLLENGSSSMVRLYKKLKAAILGIGDNITVVPRKLYIAFKRSSKNIADIEIQKNSLKVYINMPKGALDDPEFRAKDVSDIGHWGNGDYLMYVSEDADIEYVTSLIKQSYNAESVKNQSESRTQIDTTVNELEGN